MILVLSGDRKVGSHNLHLGAPSLPKENCSNVTKYFLNAALPPSGLEDVSTVFVLAYRHFPGVNGDSSPWPSGALPTGSSCGRGQYAAISYDIWAGGILRRALSLERLLGLTDAAGVSRGSLGGARCHPCRFSGGDQRGRDLASVSVKARRVRNAIREKEHTHAILRKSSFMFQPLRASGLS
jgi:hypothetical protein